MKSYSHCNIISEIWKPITSCPGNYWVSNLGRIKNFKAVKAGIIERIVKGSISPTTGYYQLYFKTSNRRWARTIHSLVAEAFIGPRPEGFVINHIDHNRTNNHASNLEYITQKENVRKASEAGRLKRAPMSEERKQFLGSLRRGKPSPYRKLTKEQVNDIRLRWPETGIKALSTEYSVSQRAIFNIVHGLSYKN